MRPIKFRTYIIPTKRMTEVTSFVFGDPVGDVEVMRIPSKRGIQYQNEKDTDHECWKSGKEASVMQFTGLCDHNDKEIYEGDVVKFTRELDDIENDHGFGRLFPIGTEAVVVWDEENAGFVLYRSHNYSQLLGLRPGGKIDPCYCGLVSMNQEITVGYYAEVIGNIYENPELLEEGAK